MSPWKIETYERKKDHRDLMQDISNLNSLLYIDNEMIWESLDKKATIIDLEFYCQNLFAEMLPQVIYEIDTKINHSTEEKRVYPQHKLDRESRWDETSMARTAEEKEKSYPIDMGILYTAEEIQKRNENLQNLRLDKEVSEDE